MSNLMTALGIPRIANGRCSGVRSAKLFSALIAFSLLLGSSAVGETNTGEVANVTLDEALSQTLTVKVIDNVATISLAQGGVIGMAISVGNALASADDIIRGKMCVICEEFIFVPIHDASSTYGAITGIVAWNGGQWDLTKLPFDRPSVTLVGSGGVSMLLNSWNDGDGNEVRQAFGFHRGNVFPLSEPKLVKEISLGRQTSGNAGLIDDDGKKLVLEEPDRVNGESAIPVKVRQPYPHMKLRFDEPKLPTGLIQGVKEILTTAGSREASALLRFLAAEFFLERDYGGIYEAGDPRDVFLAAMRLGEDQLPSFREASWRAFDARLNYPGFRLHDTRPDTYCTGAEPTFVDMAGAEAVFAAADTDYRFDWYYVRGRQAVRARPDVSAPVIGTLEDELVFSLPEEFPEDPTDEALWSKVLMPSGTIGFLEPFRAQSWLAESLCLARDATGNWKMAGFIGGGD